MRFGIHFAAGTSEGQAPVRSRLVTTLGLSTTLALAACSPAPEPVPVSAEHDGLAVEGQVTSTGGSIAVDVVVRNNREEPIHLVPDQCGRVVDVELERTAFQPEGTRWEGSVQAVKELVLRDQEFLDDGPDFVRAASCRRLLVASARLSSPRTADHPRAGRRDRRALGAAAHMSAYALAKLGSDDSVVTLEAIEARDPSEIELLRHRVLLGRRRAPRGRVVRAELPLSEVLHRAPTSPEGVRAVASCSTA